MNGHTITNRNDDLKEAVDLWYKNSEECIEKYGHISSWDVTLITDYIQKDYYYCWDFSNINIKLIFLTLLTFQSPIG
jgi:hypothetical protein